MKNNVYKTMVIVNVVTMLAMIFFASLSVFEKKNTPSMELDPVTAIYQPQIGNNSMSIIANKTRLNLMI